MSVITFTDALLAAVTKISWAQQRRDVTFESSFGSQAVEVSSPLWSVTIETDIMLEQDSGIWKSLLMRLRGPVNQLALWDPARPQPIGTMRGTMTFNASAAIGATSLSIAATGQAGKTLVAGDMIGFGSGLTQQVVMITADATANGSGVIPVSIEPPLRSAFSGGDAITWDKPMALFRMAADKLGWNYLGQQATGFKLELLEDVRP